MKAYMEHAGNLQRRRRQSLQSQPANLNAHRAGLHSLLPCKFVRMMLGRPKCTTGKTKLLLVWLLDMCAQGWQHAGKSLYSGSHPHFLTRSMCLESLESNSGSWRNFWMRYFCLPASSFKMAPASVRHLLLAGPSTLKLPPLVHRKPIISRRLRTLWPASCGAAGGTGGGCGS